MFYLYIFSLFNHVTLELYYITAEPLILPLQHSKHCLKVVYLPLLFPRTIRSCRLTYITLVLQFKQHDN